MPHAGRGWLRGFGNAGGSRGLIPAAKQTLGKSGDPLFKSDERDASDLPCSGNLRHERRIEIRLPPIRRERQHDRVPTMVSQVLDEPTVRMRPIVLRGGNSPATTSTVRIVALIGLACQEVLAQRLELQRTQLRA